MNDPGCAFISACRNPSYTFALVLGGGYGANHEGPKGDRCVPATKNVDILELEKNGQSRPVQQSQCDQGSGKLKFDWLLPWYIPLLLLNKQVCRHRLQGSLRCTSGQKAPGTAGAGAVPQGCYHRQSHNSFVREGFQH